MEVLVAEEDRTSSSSRKNVYVCCACVRVIQGTTAATTTQRSVKKSVWWPREEDKIHRNCEPCSGFSVERNQEFQGAPPGEVVSVRGKETE